MKLVLQSSIPDAVQTAFSRMHKRLTNRAVLQAALERLASITHLSERTRVHASHILETLACDVDHLQILVMSFALRNSVQKVWIRYQYVSNHDSLKALDSLEPLLQFGIGEVFVGEQTQDTEWIGPFTFCKQTNKEPNDKKEENRSLDKVE